MGIKMVNTPKIDLEEGDGFYKNSGIGFIILVDPSQKISLFVFIS